MIFLLQVQPLALLPPHDRPLRRPTRRHLLRHGAQRRHQQVRKTYSILIFKNVIHFRLLNAVLMAFRGEFTTIDVLKDLHDYKENPATRNRWDSLHREFACCGGVQHNDGYKVRSHFQASMHAFVRGKIACNPTAVVCVEQRRRPAK